MESITLRNKFKDVVNKHRHIAAHSEYDHKVCVLAVSVAARTFERVNLSDDPNFYRERVLEALEELCDSYYDSDGEYTSGKGVIGSFISDLRSVNIYPS